MARNVVVTGIKDIDDKLGLYPNSLQRKLLRKATRWATKEVVLPAAKANAPFDTGQLEESLRVRALQKDIRRKKNTTKGRNPFYNANKGRIGHQVESVETSFIGQTFYAVFQEYGTKFHAPHQYLRPALFDNASVIHAAFVEAVRQFIREAPYE